MRTYAFDLGFVRDALPTLRFPVGAWISVARERARLACLSDEALHDLGLDADAARAEAARPFWDLPARYR